jgi:hypothetical protein
MPKVRRDAVELMKQQNCSIRKAARYFCVQPSTIGKLFHRFRTDGPSSEYTTWQLVPPDSWQNFTAFYFATSREIAFCPVEYPQCLPPTAYAFCS